MRRLAALCVAAVLAGTPAAADWPTTSFLPVPPGPESRIELTESGLEPYVKDSDETEEAGGLLGYSVEGLDATAL